MCGVIKPFLSDVGVFPSATEDRLVGVPWRHTAGVKFVRVRLFVENMKEAQDCRDGHDLTKD